MRIKSSLAFCHGSADMAATVPPGVDLTADRGPEIARTCIAIAILTTFVVASRLISRKIQHADWNVADYLIIVALIGCWGETSSVLYGKPFVLDSDTMSNNSFQVWKSMG